MQKTPGDMIIFLVVTVALILFMGVFIVTILFFYRRKQITYLKEIEQIKSDYEKNLLKTQLEIQEQTFQNISRDIHDNINLSLTLAKLNLNTLNFGDKEKSVAQVNSSIDFVSKAIMDLTDISRIMNSDIITDQGLIAALHQEVEKLKKLNWFNIQFEVTGNPVFMDAQKELFIFRITQEAFNNILKHSQASLVQMQLHYNNDHLEIAVSDNGIGFTMNSNLQNKTVIRSGAGLRNMQKRAELLNGSCNVESRMGAGTSIKIIIPF